MFRIITQPYWTGNEGKTKHIEIVYLNKAVVARTYKIRRGSKNAYYVNIYESKSAIFSDALEYFCWSKKAKRGSAPWYQNSDPRDKLSIRTSHSCQILKILSKQFE